MKLQSWEIKPQIQGEVAIVVYKIANKSNEVFVRNKVTIMRNNIAIVSYKVAIVGYKVAILRNSHNYLYSAHA